MALDDRAGSDLLHGQLRFYDDNAGGRIALRLPALDGDGERDAPDGHGVGRQGTYRILKGARGGGGNHHPPAGARLDVDRAGVLFHDTRYSHRPLRL